MIVLADRDGMASLALHQSIWNGLCAEALGEDPRTRPTGTQTLTLSDADRLSAFASQCENPQGQKASLARAIVNLVRFAPGNTLRVERHLAGSGGGFWERVA